MFRPDYPLIWFNAALAFGTEDLTHLPAGWLAGRKENALEASDALRYKKKAEHVMQRSEAV